MKFIVAEISKNWQGPFGPRQKPELLQKMFEDVIAINLERGYRLHSFQLHRLMTAPDAMNETIIAVFEKH